MRMVTGLEETTDGAISIGLGDVALMFQANTLDPALRDYVQDRLSQYCHIRTSRRGILCEHKHLR